MDITLALGGGGAKGNSHIGVLRRLEKEGFRIRAVAGTSFGGIVACMYAAGYRPDEIEENFVRVDQARLFDRRPRDGPALLGLTGVQKWLEQVLGERTFADLKLPCAVTAVDLNSAREITLSEGRVRDAILATIALPGIFPPFHLKDWELVDGGVFNPVPVTTARWLAPGLPAVAVVLTGPVGKPAHPPFVPLPVPGPIARQLTRLRVAQAFRVFLRSVDASSRMLTDLRLKVDNPQVIIRPDVTDINLLDRVDPRALARRGEAAVEAALPDLKRAVAWPNRLRRRIFGGKR